jgi:copper(I)-binding protein
VRAGLPIRFVVPASHWAVLALFFGSALASACRREHVLARRGGLVITGAYAHPSAGDAGAVYIKMRNEGSMPDTMIGIGGPDPAMAVLMGTTAGRMEMLPPLVVNPGERVLMQPGGLHIMFTGLTGEYKVGDTLRVTLTFSRAGQIPVTAAVVPFGEMPE